MKQLQKATNTINYEDPFYIECQTSIWEWCWAIGSTGDRTTAAVAASTDRPPESPLLNTLYVFCQVKVVGSTISMVWNTSDFQWNDFDPPFVCLASNVERIYKRNGEKMYIMAEWPKEKLRSHPNRPFFGWKFESFRLYSYLHHQEVHYYHMVILDQNTVWKIVNLEKWSQQIGSSSEDISLLNV